MHYNTGWVVIGIIGFNVAVNLIVEVWQIAIGLRRLWMKFYFKLTGQERTNPKDQDKRAALDAASVITPDMPRLKLS
jgi:hypothetical protein